MPSESGPRVTSVGRSCDRRRPANARASFIERIDIALQRATRVAATPRADLQAVSGSPHPGAVLRGSGAADGRPGFRRTFRFAAAVATTAVFLIMAVAAGREAGQAWVPRFPALERQLDASTRREERDRMTRMFEAFHHASMLIAIPAGQAIKHTSAGTDSLIYRELERGLSTGESVSDAYLDWLDPAMKQHFRNELLAGNRLYLDGLLQGDTDKQVTAIQTIAEWQQFWRERGAEIASRASTN